MANNYSDDLARSERLALGDVLVAAGAVSRAQLDATMAQERQLTSQGRSVRLEDLLIRNRFTTAAQIHAAMMSSGEFDEESEVSSILLTPSVCSKFQVMPVSSGGGVLVVKSARPISQVVRDAILASATVRCASLKVICADKHEMHSFLSKQMAHDSFASMLERLRTTDHTSDLIRMAIEALLHESIDLHVSDIHFDLKPEPDSWISLRIDGGLEQKFLLTERFMASLCSRVKTLCGMDASNSRVAQDGRLEMDHRGRMVGFRVASQPLVDGETITIRIIDAASLPTVQVLFPYQPAMLELLDSVSSINGKSGGLMLVTGPTGSGKSTTLYTLASMFAREKQNLITVENPVEYKLPFARQIQLQDLLGQKATDVERSILRQDPDVLIFGEIRDAESARAALKFAESGHFVLSTLHAQSAGTTTERLMSMIPEEERGEAAFVMAETLKSIVNQRLFRRLCECAEVLDIQGIMKIEGARDLERVLGAALPKTLRCAVGCHQCRGMGYRGRVAVHETIIFAGNEKHREALARTLSSRSPIKSLLSTRAIRMISQADTVMTLLSTGIMDIPTAVTALNVREITVERDLQLVGEK